MTVPHRDFGVESKLRILAAAESLYARRSIDSVSFREIAQAAGNGNTNAVQYHFGDKAGLIHAIFAWRVWQMEPSRGRGMDKAEAEGKSLHLPTLMRILCEPVLDLTDDQGRHTYAAFMNKFLMFQFPADMIHFADTHPELSSNLRRVLNNIYSLVVAEDKHRGDYRVALSYMMVTNMIELSDNEGIAKRSMAQFRNRFEVALTMATAALQRSLDHI
ncbi:MAG: helix-turn-helix domain-containing protein [Sphingobium sp.]